jgi:hypothetical protein
MKRKSAKISREFDETEFLLLAFVAVVLLAFVIWQGGILPSFISSSVLGVSAIR